LGIEWDGEGWIRDQEEKNLSFWLEEYGDSFLNVQDNKKYVIT
jgi:hypothetical protein